MNKSTDKYTYRVTWSEEDQEYVGLCSEFPSLSWLEQDQIAALNGIRKLVSRCKFEPLYCQQVALSS